MLCCVLVVWRRRNAVINRLRPGSDTFYNTHATLTDMPRTSRYISPSEICLLYIFDLVYGQSPPPPTKARDKRFQTNALLNPCYNYNTRSNIQHARLQVTTNPITTATQKPTRLAQHLCKSCGPHYHNNCACTKLFKKLVTCSQSQSSVDVT